jgi:hypothetical protein
MKSFGENDVPDFLLELVDRGYSMGFLVAYVFLVAGPVPERYKRSGLLWLGCAGNLHVRLED